MDWKRPTSAFGIIPLTDCAPIVIAQEKGYFKKYGLNTAISKEASWANIRDKVSIGALDGAHMLAGMPIAATLGRGRHTQGHHHGLFHGPERQRHHGFQRTLRAHGGGWPHCDEDAAHHCGRAEESDRSGQEGRQGADDARHGVSGFHPQLRTSLLARFRRHQPGQGHPPDRHSAAADGGQPAVEEHRRLLRG